MTRITPEQLKDLVQLEKQDVDINEYINEIDTCLEVGQVRVPIEFPHKNHPVLAHEVKSHYIIEGFKCNWIRVPGERISVQELKNGNVKMCLEFYID